MLKAFSLVLAFYCLLYLVVSGATRFYKLVGECPVRFRRSTKNIF